MVAGPYDGVESLVTVEFRDAGKGETEIVVLHERLLSDKAIADHSHGWNARLDKLVTCLVA